LRSTSGECGIGFAARLGIGNILTKGVAHERVRKK